MPGDAGLSTGLEFCRREIERRRHLLRRVLLWSFGPVLLAIGTFILALAMVGGRDRGIFPNAMPFMTLVVIWIARYFVIRMREQRELQREIDKLSDIEREQMKTARIYKVQENGEPFSAVQGPAGSAEGPVSSISTRFTCILDSAPIRFTNIYCSPAI